MGCKADRLIEWDLRAMCFLANLDACVTSLSDDYALHVLLVVFFIAHYHFFIKALSILYVDIYTTIHAFIFDGNRNALPIFAIIYSMIHRFCFSK